MPLTRNALARLLRQSRLFLAAVLLAGIVRLVPKGEAAVFRAVLVLCEALRKTV